MKKYANKSSTCTRSQTFTSDFLTCQCLYPRCTAVNLQMWFDNIHTVTALKLNGRGLMSNFRFSGRSFFRKKKVENSSRKQSPLEETCLL